MNEFKAQCAEPITGSSKIDACGLKNLEKKSQLSPTAVTITPPGSRFIRSNNCLSKIIANGFGLGEGGDFHHKYSCEARMFKSTKSGHTKY